MFTTVNRHTKGKIPYTLSSSYRFSQLAQAGGHTLFGASLSEPHINVLNASGVCMYVCMYVHMYSYVIP